MFYYPAALDAVIAAMFELAVRDVKTRVSYDALCWLSGVQGSTIATVMAGIDPDVYESWIGELRADFERKVREANGN